jgi:hypothetical protein
MAPWAGVEAALAAAASKSAGVRAREMIIVNRDREFAARFVIVERTVIQERSANRFIFERSELTFKATA